MRHPSRRHFAASTAAAGVLGAAPWPILAARPALAAPATTIRAATRVIEVHSRAALHCHHLCHMAAGMMTTVEYRS
jgi:hypothetical protein